MKTWIYSITYDNSRTYYQSRALFTTKQAPAFIMTDREKSGAADGNSFYSALTSFPMYAKYAKVESVRTTQFERLMIMMKDPKDKDSVGKFLRDMRQSIEAGRD